MVYAGMRDIPSREPNRRLFLRSRELPTLATSEREPLEGDGYGTE